MNRGLNEAAAHKPLREKQRIIRSLDKVMEYLGTAIAGFSPQVSLNFACNNDRLTLD